ncbi:pleckstrin homology domain-containing family N member 1 isoform X4 [Vicugna pacos]|uniref:Pleckstrin homology domain-containing family N member 1 isoform X4 n=1 Tax=Vicugna pacos TaxID=30538 RepID=A0ABM5EF88_VICPA
MMNPGRRGWGRSQLPSNLAPWWVLQPHVSQPCHRPKAEPSCVALPAPRPIFTGLPQHGSPNWVWVQEAPPRGREAGKLSLSVHIPRLAQRVAQLGQGTVAPASSPVPPEPQTSAPPAPVRHPSLSDSCSDDPAPVYRGFSVCRDQLVNIPGLESQRENLEQPFLSVFKAGRRRAAIRSLGKVVHYAKVQLRFQHSQDISDCYLELFPSHLYFQAHGSEGLTFQGLLPLMELSVCPLEGSREHAFQITGPLPAPLHVLCPSQAELGRWLYHLEKQIALVGGLPRCQPVPQVSAGSPTTPSYPTLLHLPHTSFCQGPPEDEPPWALQRRLTQLRAASGHQAVGSAVCASRVKLQHLPSQEQWDRLLVLYPTSLAIFSEEADVLCFKGELPLSAIHVNLEERGKQIRSFLIEGRLINAIRVVCASYEDYSRWLLCLQTVCRRGGTAPGLRVPAQVVGSDRGSLSSDGQASWDSGCLAAPSTHASHALPGSVPSTEGCPAQPAPEQANSGCTSASGQRAKLRRNSGSRSPRSKARGKGPSPAVPLHLDLTKLSLGESPEAPDHSLEKPHSPLYADPYTPPATSHHKITDVRGLDEVSPATEVSPDPLPPPPDGRPPRSYDSIWDKALSPSHQQWSRGAPQAGEGVVQWI